ncbi:Glu/Leu/Phe/Val family dehydrogenase [Sphingomonas sp. C3-2]|uniref:Glu/Leu/Phe/Val family dehydrogenase n=1 Tax=Sphingomonas sp. C3-2 TaxID=3062169 RepID=UPI00294B2706|nr:Glu/Leu/Phe/Val dehydrogenase dimerization domain-containing protein [Sphingomonas sp. C3-2]WOK36822.1 Glu/Leu/Phe/Val dehydrogenase dimerization domain-containing protein [Sphingomonas sp. C3-2]
MVSVWEYPDFDDHEGVHLFRDVASGLTAVICVHSSHLGPAMGGARFWNYADKNKAITDALRLSRGMSFKNAMADLPLGGGKGVILANDGVQKTPELLAAFGRAVESLAGRYVTAEDVGINDADMIQIATATRHVAGLPVEKGSAGGDPGPFTALGVFLGVKAAAERGLGKTDMAGVHVAVQGLGSVGGRVARLLAAEGARLTIADVNAERAKAMAAELGATAIAPDEILTVEADIISPNALGAVLTEQSIAALRTTVVAGGANNQLATPADGHRLKARGILYAPDYVINAGGIINVGLEYLKHGDQAEVEARIHRIAGRLHQIWDESEATGDPASDVADRIAMRLIGRA